MTKPNLQMRESRVLQQIRPMLLTMQVLGWLPAQRNNSDMLYINKKTKIYAAIVLSFQLLPAAYIIIRGLKLIPTLDSSFRLFSYVQILCGVMMPELATLFVFLQAPNHVQFWNNTQHLLMEIEKISLSQKPFKFGKIKRISIIYLTLGATPLIFIMVITPSVLNVTLTWKFAFYVAFGEGIMILTLGWWIAVTNTICITSQRLIDDFKLLCECNESGRTGNLVGKLALEMRTLWLQLFHLAHTLGNVLSIALTIIMLNCFSFSIYILYQIIAVQNIITMLFYILASFLGLGIIYGFCSCGENVVIKLMTFFIQLYQTSPRVSFNSYIILQKKMIASIIYVLITNMLVLYQLDISERRLQLQEVFSFAGGDIL